MGFLLLFLVVTYLTGSVDDFGGEGLAAVDNLVREGVLDGRIVALDEVAFAVLDGE
jgi:hypothetical protein